MRFRDIETPINSISELYDFLEGAAVNLDYSWDFVEAISKLKQSTKDPELLQCLQWEIACFTFEFRGAELFSLTYTFDHETEETGKYPSANDFERAGFEYIIGRIDHVKNPLLKARYNHLLWKAPKGIKKQQYAWAAVDSYVGAIIQMLDIKEKKKDERYLQVSNLYESLIELCDETNYNDINQVKQLTSDMLFKRAAPFFLKHSVLGTMMKHQKCFKATDFVGALDLFERELVAEGQRDDFLMVTYYLPTALRIAQKVNDDVKKWHNHSGDCFLRLAEKETVEERNWIKQKWYSQAIYSYGMAANVLRKQEVEQRYFELKPKVKLNTVRFDLNPDEVEEINSLYKQLEKDAEKILKQPTLTVYHIISIGKGLFPSAERIRSQKSNYDFLNFASRVDFDRNKNITTDHTNRDTFLDPYHMEVQTVSTPFLESIFVKGIETGKLTFENFILFLKHKTWMGRSFTRIDLGGDSEEINWIKLLAPSIVEYFVQTSASLRSKSYSPDYTLCIDSLAMKLEGLLRNFCEQLNLAINVMSRKGIQEANINQILELDGLKQYFDEDDFSLFRYLLVNEGGVNLRNNVAHCFYNHQDYRRSKMHLLLAAILRIGKFQISTSTTH